MRTRHFVILLGLLCVSTADAFAQEDAERMAEVLCLGDPECLAISKHRLTSENLRKMFAADRELIALMKQLPDLERRMDEMEKRIDPQGQLGKHTRSARVLEGIPEIAQVLRRHQTTGREYVFTHAVAMVTAMTDSSFPSETQRGGRTEVPPEVMTPALKFWRSMDPALKAEAEAWQKMRGYDKGFNR